ncbi:hypothetical protein [Amnibacterium endophyticum]|uniref:Tat pathway signal sequence domain protein n=1 Tax=Amnibacterium endophyticum TaxID=2109337 RepID=A0ABW4LGF4_9MICO
MPATPRLHRKRFAPLAIAASLVASTTLGLSATGTLSAFTASITNSNNTAATGSLIMQETDSAGTTSCLSTSGTGNAYTSCSTINKYGGTTNQLTPGGAPNVTTVRLYNTGTTAVNGFTLAPGTCTKSGSGTGDLCGQLQLTLTCAPVTGGTAGTAVTLYNAVALNALGASKDIKAASATCVPPTSSTDYVRFTFSVQLSSSADNTVQAQSVSQPLVWTYTGA